MRQNSSDISFYNDSRSSNLAQHKNSLTLVRHSVPQKWREQSPQYCWWDASSV